MLSGGLALFSEEASLGENLFFIFNNDFIEHVR